MEHGLPNKRNEPISTGKEALLTLSPQRSSDHQHQHHHSPLQQESPRGGDLLLTLEQQQQDGSSTKANNGDSPESGSLYSDEIPSGYNSGEQYDTLSTGYMSGEAYELPETRLELHKPALDIIEECLQPLDGRNDDSDANIFVLPFPVGGHHDKDKDNASLCSSSTSSDEPGGNAAAAGAISNKSTDGSCGTAHYIDVDLGGTSSLPARSPGSFGSKSKFRKTVNMLTIPMETAAATLSVGADFDPGESSDAGAATGGYRAVPSDTDTSAFESDANAIGLLSSSQDYGDGGGDGESDAGIVIGSGENQLVHASVRTKTKAERMAARKARRMRRHDEEWFNANDSKYWVAARQACFWLSVVFMICSTFTAGVLIYLMPRQCDPPHHWYQGKVMMNISPDVKDGKIHLDNLIATDLTHYVSLGVQTFHLRNLSSAPTDSLLRTEYPRTFGGHNTTELEKMLRSFLDVTHRLNRTVMTHVRIVGRKSELEKGFMTVDLEYAVAKVIEFWANLEVDGLFLDGLEHFAGDPFIASSIKKWDDVFAKYGPGGGRNRRILMTSYRFAHELAVRGNEGSNEAITHFQLLDAELELATQSNNISALSERVMNISTWDAIEGRPWINWNLESNDGEVAVTKAHLAFQFFMPGTVSVDSTDITSNDMYANSTIADKGSLDQLSRVRAVAVPIFMNGNYRRCDCDPTGFEKETNLAMRAAGADLVQMERFYSRRNRYLLVANFGSSGAGLQAVADMYSAGELLVDTTGDLEVGVQQDIDEVVLQPGHALVFKLPK